MFKIQALDIIIYIKAIILYGPTIKIIFHSKTAKVCDFSRFIRQMKFEILELYLTFEKNK